MKWLLLFCLTAPLSAQILRCGDVGCLTNPMTTAGDIIIGGALGTPTRFPAASGYLHWNGSAFVYDNPAGSGSVTNFSAGNLSPLFTTSVATATSTPALSFSLSNAAQGSVYGGPASGGAGAPSFQVAPTISAANMTSFPTLNQNTTGNAATATALAATPTLCGTGNAPTGVLANGNATGCAAIGGGGGTPGGSTDDVQFRTSGAAFGGGRCTMSSSNVMTCTGGFVGGANLTFGGTCIATGSVATPSAGALNYFCNSGNANHLTSKDSSAALIDLQPILTRRIAAYVFDGGGSPLSGTQDACVDVPVASTITGITLLSDVSGSGTVDVRTVSYSGYTGPASATTITASAVPVLSGAVKYQDTTLTGWTTSVPANAVICFHLTSPATSTWIMADLKGN